MNEVELAQNFTNIAQNWKTVSDDDVISFKRFIAKE